MMLRIDFYVCETTPSREIIACRLIEKAYQQHQRVYVHTASQQHAHAFDEQLWTFEDNSFVPHNLIEEKILPAPPVRIGFGDILSSCEGILINLTDTQPTAYRQFNRIIELVNDDNKDIKREQFKHYRALGCEIQSYKV